MGQSFVKGSAFTLIEVVLAMAIATGILAVVLFFYQQAERLRTQLLEETSRISAARLVLDRLTYELSIVQRCETFPAGLAGSTDNIHFVNLSFPGPSFWTNRAELSPTTNRAELALTIQAVPLRLISYAIQNDTNGTPVTGLARTEELLSKKKTEPAVESEAAEPDTIMPRRNSIPAEQLQYVRFRYWNGISWLDSWSAPELPSGVEVSLGAEPLPEGMTPDEYPFELYRRVIYMPCHTTNQYEQASRR